MSRMWFEVRYALRQLRRSPGFTLAAVLTLAFGIGATTAIFSIVEGVLLRPLPFAEPDRLVTVGDKLEGLDFGGEPGTTAPEVRTYTRESHAFASLGGYKYATYAFSGAGDAVEINGARLTASIFETLGVSPMMGRVFTRQEDEGAVQVAVISYPMWRSHFQADPNVIGRTIQLNRKPYEIIGVMPRDFEFPLVPGQLSRSEIWVPMSFAPDELDLGSSMRWDCDMIGRLKPGVSAAQAAGDLSRVAEDVMRSLPPDARNVRIRPVVTGLHESAVAKARPLLRMLFLAVAAVLCIACVNLAALLLLRVTKRQRAIAVQMAMGARSGTVVRQCLVETMLLCVGGGVLGLVLASSGLQAGLSVLPETLPRVSAIGLDWKVVAFTIGLTMMTGLLCGLVPAVAAAHTGVIEALKDGGRTGTSGAGHVRLRSALVVAEVAMALTLLIASGLLLRSFNKIRAVDLGFKTDHMLTAAYSLPQQQYSTQAAVDAFNASLLAKLQQSPGVLHVGVTTSLPVSGNGNNWNAFFPEGYVAPKGEGMIQAWAARVVAGDYFSAAGIPIVRGRGFNASDGPNTPLVVVVNRKLAEHYWPGQDPIGKRIHLGLPDTPVPWMTVVGEIGDIKETSADAATKNQFYTLSSQVKASSGKFADPHEIDGEFGVVVVRSQQTPEQMTNTLRGVVRSLDPQLPLTNVQSMDEIVQEGQAAHRFNTVLVSSFAIAALLLALLGAYSVIAFSASLRTHEMAIRLALGGQRLAVAKLVLATSARMALMGCGLGFIASLFATRLLRSMLYEVNALDPAVMVASTISILLLVLAVSLIPARRAACVDPMQSLRAE